MTPKIKNRGFISALLQNFGAPLLVAVVVGSVVFVRDSREVDTKQCEKITHMKVEIRQNVGAIKELKTNYNGIKYSMVEVQSNQKHIMKQLDRIVNKLYPNTNNRRNEL